MAVRRVNHCNKVAVFAIGISLIFFHYECSQDINWLYHFLICCCLYDGFVLQLRSEIVAAHRRMIHGLDNIWWPWLPGTNVAKFSDICLTVEGKHRKNLNQEIDPTGDRTRTRCVTSSDVTSRLPFSNLWFHVTFSLSLPVLPKGDKLK